MSPDDVDNTATGQELLENLIKEGLTPSGDDNEPSRYRRLVQVLLHNCILKPIERNIAPNVQQAGYTITILKRQINLHPSLLLDRVDEDDQIPFYQWLLPRLIYAALRLNGDTLVEDLISSAVDVIHTLGKDMSDDDSSWAKGPKRVSATLAYLNAFCQAAMPSCMVMATCLVRQPRYSSLYRSYYEFVSLSPTVSPPMLVPNSLKPAA
ncbi:hypothetical protein IAR55_003488 [Kwoniella newhampshirensis]|uniref:Uncharacterized protein n=1 Tax=Kwoniella newhampshirensis TaxID=1651941 RepID=A0AAW0YMS9_9TREE